MGPSHSSNGNCFSISKPNRASSQRSPASNDCSRGSRYLVLKEIDFRGGNFRDVIKTNPNATSVRLDVDAEEEWIPMDNDLEQLKGLQQLTFVDLSGCQEITRRGLEYISLKPAQIRVLILNDCYKITDKFLDHYIEHFNGLERLELRGCFRVSDKGVGALLVLKHLRHLDISVHATQDGVIPTAQSGCGIITNASMAYLLQMTKLEALLMDQCNVVTDDGITKLVTLKNLTSLSLSATGLTDSGLKLLKHFPRLAALNVSQCYLSESQTLQYLSKASRLTALNISRVPGVTDKLIQGLASSSIDLKRLDISGCDHLSDECLTHICTWSSLTHLNANGCLGIRGKSIGCLSSLSQLRSLHVNEVVDIDCEDLLRLESLQQLEMGTISSEDEQLSKLSSLEHLTDLTLHLSAEGPSKSANILGIRVHLLKHAPEASDHRTGSAA